MNTDRVEFEFLKSPNEVVEKFHELAIRQIPEGEKEAVAFCLALNILEKETDKLDLRQLDVLSDDNFNHYIGLVTVKDSHDKWGIIKDRAFEVLERTDCRICVHAILHGWWGDTSITHCRDCHKTWNIRTSEAHCTICHRHFKASYMFDKHMYVDGTHGDPMQKGKVFYIDDSGKWRQSGPESPHWAEDLANELDRRSALVQDWTAEGPNPPPASCLGPA